MFRKLVTMLAAVAVVAVLLVPVVSLSTLAAAQTAGDVSVRDQLIANQEALLNVYRCRFSIDTQIVPGGCANGKPVAPPAQPVPFDGTPTEQDIAARDGLIVAQESLLNVYRCRFNIDTQIVPGGCPDGSGQGTTPTQPTPAPTSTVQPTPIPTRTPVSVTQPNPYADTDSTTIYLDYQFCIDGIGVHSIGDEFGTPQFGDVDPSRPAAQFIRCMRALGLDSGINSNAYRPDDSLSRAEAASYMAIMWESAGKVCQPGDSVPYGDVPAGSSLAAFVGCLHSEGISIGSSATAYSPNQPLGGRNMVLMLHRWFQAWRGDSGVSGGNIGIGRVCRQTGTELTRAQGCLKEIGVMFNSDNILAQTTISRAEAARYFVGMLYVVVHFEQFPVLENVVDLESSSIDAAMAPGVDPLAIFAIVPDLDPRLNVPVVYCGPSGAYSSADISRTVGVLNSEVAPFYGRQSSGMFAVNFTQGGIVEVPLGNDFKMTDSSLIKCRADAVSVTGTSQILILADTIPPRGFSGVGTYFTGPSWVYLRNKRSPSARLYGTEPLNLFVASHELDHSLLGIVHTGEFLAPYTWVYLPGGGTRLGCKTPTSSAQFPCTYVGDLGNISDGEPVLACYDRERLGWPIGAGSSPCGQINNNIPLILDGATYSGAPQIEKLTINSNGSLIANIGSTNETFGDYYVHLFAQSSSDGSWSLHSQKAVDSGRRSVTFTGLRTGGLYELVVSFSSNTQVKPGIHFSDQDARRFVAMATPGEIAVSDMSSSPVNSISNVSYQVTLPRFRIPPLSRYISWGTA